MPLPAPPNAPQRSGWPRDRPNVRKCQCFWLKIALRLAESTTSANSTLTWCDIQRHLRRIRRHCPPYAAPKPSSSRHYVSANHAVRLNSNPDDARCKRSSIYSHPWIASGDREAVLHTNGYRTRRRSYRELCT
jgi:hypothetical protein